jgi:hypothetical protein
MAAVGVVLFLFSKSPHVLFKSALSEVFGADCLELF